MKKDQKEQNPIDKQREDILQERFKVGPSKDECEYKSLEEIIYSVIDAIKNNNDIKDRIKKYWFTKQIEEWKEKNNTDKDPEDDDLMEIVKEDLEVRMANTMLALEQELKKQKDINKDDIWFYQDGYYVALKQHILEDICDVSNFDDWIFHASPPYKPFFINNPNDNGKLNCVCIYKHGDEYEDSETKWIMACFKNYSTNPQCKITFKTNKDNKITNVKIETEKDSNSGKSIYTISLDTSGVVERITKEGEGDTNKNYTKEIQQLLFEDKTNKVLIDSIEDELDNQQKVVFEEIKKYLCIEKDTKKEKEEENKEEEKGEKKEEDNKNDNTIADNINNQQSNASLQEVKTRKWFSRYTADDGREYFSCFCCDIPL